jgi:hypothetical protein
MQIIFFRCDSSILSKSTCPQNIDYQSYNYVNRLSYEPNSLEYVSPTHIQFFNIQTLRTQLPVNDHFWSMVPRLDQLAVLHLLICTWDENCQDQLQVLINRAPRLSQLHIEADPWTESQMDPSEIKSVSVSELILMNYFRYDSEHCLRLIHSPIGIQCQVLHINVENRTCIIDLVDKMINLRTLNVRCRDDEFSSMSFHDRFHKTDDELVRWLQEQLLFMRPVVRISRWLDDNIIKLWIR